jgi:acyl transferase domain-containing protein
MMSRLPSGAMLAVECAEQDVLPLLDKRLGIASVNGPVRCVVAGPTAEVSELATQLQARGINCRRLRVSHAFHSPMMDPILEPFLEYMKPVRLSRPQIPYVSNLTGMWITAAEATDHGYWNKHLRHTVRFADGIQTLLSEPGSALLEVGPGRTLGALLAQSRDKSASQFTFASLRHPSEKTSDVELILRTLGQLWLAGARPDWAGFHSAENRRRVSLPTYPFERKRFWFDAPHQDTPAEPAAKAARRPPVSPSAQSDGHPATAQSAAPAERPAGKGRTSGHMLERIVAQQMQVMEEQLNQQRLLLHRQLALLRAARGDRRA